MNIAQESVCNASQGQRRLVVASKPADKPDCFWLTLACLHRVLWTAPRNSIPGTAKCRECSMEDQRHEVTKCPNASPSATEAGQ